MYKILPYTKARARRINVIVRPSKRQGKKLDVFDRQGNYITSVGAKGYLDYPSYRKLYGREIAEKRRKLYKMRHKKDRKIRNTSGWFADQLLW